VAATALFGGLFLLFGVVNSEPALYSIDDDDVVLLFYSTILLYWRLFPFVLLFLIQ